MKEFSHLQPFLNTARLSYKIAWLVHQIVVPTLLTVINTPFFFARAFKCERAWEIRDEVSMTTRSSSIVDQKAESGSKAGSLPNGEPAHESYWKSS